MKPLYIFDLDGTLALIDHRRPILNNKENPHRWDDFYDACDKDDPNEPIVKIFNSLRREELHCGHLFNEIWIWSGRSMSVQHKTELWMNRYIGIYGPDHLKMRPIGNSIPDQDLKRKWYEELSIADKERLVCIFDDRKKVVDMWRSLGITCLQVAPGDF